MNWKVYYSDDDTISSEETTPFEITKRADVQVIVQDNIDHGWATLCGTDYYVWDDRHSGLRWWGVDQFGFYHYLLQPGDKCVLFGISIDNKRFREIFDRARGEREKSGFVPNERQP